MFYLILGGKEREIEYEKLIKKIRDDNPGIVEKRFDAYLKEHETFLSTISINSMFGGKELVILKRSEELKKFWDFLKILKNYNMDNKIVVIDYLDEDNKFSKKARKIAEELGKIIESKVDKDNKGISSYVKKELNISDKESFELVEMIGNDLHRMKNEIEKIKNFLDDELFDMNKVKKIISINKEYSIFQVIEEFLKGKKDNLIDYLRIEKAYMLFLYTISKELRILLKMKLLEEEGKLRVSFNYNAYNKEIYPKIKDYFKTNNRPMHPYALFKKLERLNDFDKTFLKEKIREALKVETNIKSGIIDEKIGMEVFVMNF